MSQRPDVVITDYRMPDGNGMELCLQIKSNPETENIPVILLTGEGDESLQLQSLKVQVDHYLEKPVNMVILRSAISQVLRVREAMRNKVNRDKTVNDIPKPVLEKEQEKHETKIRRAVISYLEEEMIFIQANENDKTFYVEHLYYISIPNYVWFWIHKCKSTENETI